MTLALARKEVRYIGPDAFSYMVINLRPQPPNGQPSACSCGSLKQGDGVVSGDP
jgi:hypothetical protein